MDHVSKMEMRARQTRWSQLGVAVVTALVIGVAVFNREPPRPLPPPEASYRALFDEVVKEEPSAREKARDDWPHHPWSQQDGFGAFESSRVAQVAAEKGLWPQDVFMVVDFGLRAGWPGPDGKPLDTATVPLKPRAMD